MVAVGIVARPPKKHVTRPSAASHALFRIIAAAAEPPQIIDRAIAHVAKWGGAFPNFAQRMVAHVASRPGFGGERRAPFDCSIGLDAERTPPGAARGHMTARHPTLQHTLVGAEVADVVAGPKPHAELVAPSLEPSQERK